MPKIVKLGFHCIKLHLKLGCSYIFGNFQPKIVLKVKVFLFPDYSLVAKKLLLLFSRFFQCCSLTQNLGGGGGH